MPITNVSQAVSKYMNDAGLNDRTLAAKMTDALLDYPYPTDRSISHTSIFYWRNGQTTKPDLAKLMHVRDYSEDEQLAEFCRALIDAAKRDNPEPDDVVERESVSPLQDSTT